MMAARATGPLLVRLAAGLLFLAGRDAATAAETPVLFPPIVVTTSAAGHDAFTMPQATTLVTEDALRDRQARTLPSALEELPGIMVQKTGTAQGSPYLRGFTGFRTLLLVDGIRLNNSVFRDGPNQYWGTVDPLGLERLEVVKGPGAVAHGSDAVGGTVNAVTRNLAPAGPPGAFSGRLLHRFASADESHVGRIDAATRLNGKTTAQVGLAAKRFGDLRSGDGIQPYTGYDERGGEAKLVWRRMPEEGLTILWQDFAQADAWRTHTTVHGSSWQGTRPGGDQRRSLDQHRRLQAIQYHAAPRGDGLDRWHVSLSRQEQSEDQLRIRADGRREKSGFHVETLGALAHGRSPAPGGHWTYGGEFFRDHVTSHATRYLADGTLVQREIQGPVAGRATYDLGGLYLEHHRRGPGGMNLVVGGRLSQASADARDVREPRSGRAIQLKETWRSAVGAARAVLPLRDDGRRNLFAGISQAFRAPNLSDLTRFDIAEGGQIETPAPGLAPERATAFEAGWRVRERAWSAEVAVFHTDLRRQIIRTPTGARVDGLAEVTKRNSGAGYCHGVEASGSLQPSAAWTLWAHATWMRGALDYFPSADAVRLERGPMSRVMPPTVHAGARWRTADGRAWLAISTTAAARQDRLAPADRVDRERIPPAGTPGYHVVSLRTGWRPRPSLVFNAALENITDTPYRVHGSGVNEPGRGIVVTTELGF